MSDAFTGPAPTDIAIPRDRWKRPLITPPGGGEPVPYVRVSTLAGILEDAEGLTKWKVRQAARGLTLRDDLRIGVAALLAGFDKEDDPAKLKALNKELDKLLDQAMEAAGSSSGSTMGTALHTFTEKIDRGINVGQVPKDIADDLKAYSKATANMRMIGIESFIVCDEIRAAGTFDRLIEWDGVLYIGDLKTGRIDYPNKFAIQKAIYAHGKAYNPTNGQRASIGDIDLNYGLLIHLPPGKGVCEIHWVDIERGWEAAQHADWVRTWRSSKDITTPVHPDQLEGPTKNLITLPPTPAAAPVAVESVKPTLVTPPTVDQLAGWVAQASTVGHLTQLWQAHGALFTPELNELASAKHALITGAVLAPPA